MTNTQASGLLVSLALIGLSYISSARAVLPTDKQSFTLRTSLRLVDRDGSSKVIYLRESYSRPQNRAAFHFEANLRDKQDNVVYKPSLSGHPLAGRGKTHSVYLDQPESSKNSYSLVYVDRTDSDCSLIDLNFFNFMLNLHGYLPAGAQSSDPLILGAASLLFFINRSQKKKSRLDGQLLVRNIPTVAYSLNYRNELGETIQVIEIYADSSTAGDHPDVPIQIILDRPNGGSLIVDFAHIQLLSNGMNPSRQKSDVELDEFAIDPDFRCPQSLIAAGREVELFAGAKTDRIKFTFTATDQYSRTFELGTGKQEMFVAYDARVDSMRVDLWQPQNSHADRRVEISNFALNLRYDIEVTDSDQTAREALKAKGEDTSVSTRCHSGRIRPNKEGGSANDRQLSPGRLLLGSDRFVYLGRARVRGLDAKMYTVEEDLEIPYWLDQPVAVRFKDKSDEFERGDRRTQDRPTNIPGRKITTVIYVADQASAELPILLKVDILERDPDETRIHSLHSLSIQSFAWHLGADGPFGERASELFSLVDMCAAGLGANLFARVHLLLEQNNKSKDKLDPEMQPTALERNSALLGALQRELRLPANLVFDMQSREGQNNLLAVSFRVADHLSSQVQPIYLGQGRPSPTLSGFSKSRKKRHFHECLLWAASKQSDAFFGYDALAHTCWVDTASNLSRPSEQQAPTAASESFESHWPASFIPDERSTMEVYKVTHVTDKSRVLAKNWLIEHGNSVKHQELIGKKLYPVDYTAKGDSQFVIRRSQMDERDLRSPLEVNSDAGPAAPMDATTTDRLVGYAFVDGAEGNRKISAEDFAADKWASVDSGEKSDFSQQQMTLEKCQAACLSDFDCQSFSVCVRAGLVECILSRANLRSPDFVEQFHLELENSPKSTLVQLKVGERQVELLRKRLCTIHIKRYLEMFQEPVEEKESFSSRAIHQVSSREECARLCVQQTLDTLKDEVANAGKMLSLSSDGAKDALELTVAVAKHRESVAQFCSKFYYIDRADVQGQTSEVELRNRVLNKETDCELVDGYCLLADHTSKEELKAVQNLPAVGQDPAGETADWQAFKFNTELLYERQFGVHLSASDVSLAESQAYRLLQAGREAELTEEQMSDMRKLVAEGRNLQEISSAHAHQCASLCFSQVQGPWPACRSFDVVVRVYGDNSRSFGCYMNSVTIAQALASDQSKLVQSYRTISGKDVQVWHYEPRAGLTLESSLLGANLALANSRFSLFSSTLSPSNTIHSLGALMLALLGVVSGLLVALLFRPKAIELVAPVAGRRQSVDREQMIGAHQEFEIVNHANHKGLVMQ